MKNSQLVSIVQGILIGKDADFTRVSIDSRTVQNGDCFFAIRGDVFDGHQFIADVAKKNAVVAIVDDLFEIPRDFLMPVIQVKDTRKALMDLARFYRESTAIPVAAITGSCGKTTTRALLETILKQRGDVLASQKSFNNDIGVPLTLLQLQPAHQFAVLEVGANHVGEIASLTQIVQPTVATITLAAPVHLEGFGSVENIARAKGEIFQGLRPDGIAVINADDVFADFWKTLAGARRVVTFGCKTTADVMARDIHAQANGQTHFILQLPTESTSVMLPLLGEHNVMNALAAAAMAFAMDTPIDFIKTGLETSEPVYGRMVEKKGYAGVTIIDDSYNANPTSVTAAIKLLVHRSRDSILVLGDMLELGPDVDAIHYHMGEVAAQLGVQQLFCYGKYCVQTAKAFGKNGHHFETHQALIDALKPSLTSNVTVLVKGSRGMKMETIINGIL